VGTLYYLDVPVASGLAELHVPYVPVPDPPTCDRCLRRLVPRYPEGALDVYWEPGSDNIGDWVFAYANLVARRTVLYALQERCGEFEIGSLAMHSAAPAPESRKASKRRASCVRLPYAGPELGFIRDLVEIDPEPHSTVTVGSTCASCRYTIYSEVRGMETVPHGRGRVPRVAGEGWVFRADDVPAGGLFRPRTALYCMCTQSVRDWIEAQGWTNLRVLEAGETVD
jgi:hypothetical protein